MTKQVEQEDLQASEADSNGLTKYLGVSSAWALALGCAIGWGAFVMPATTLLPKAGPIGTILGMGIAAAIMIVIAAAFHFMLNRNLDSGGAFTFTKRVLGYDHAFLCAWALFLGYIAIMWANATAFILIVRFVLGPVFQFGFHYTVAGYDVYFGEILVTLAILGGFGVLSMANKRVINVIYTTLAFILMFGVVACFIIVAAAFGITTPNLEPAFSPEVNPGFGVFGIVALAPWAFLGFEVVSHGAGEITFSPKKLFAVMAAGVAGGAIIYILMTMVSVMGAPDGYDNWTGYIFDIGNLEGFAGLPTFNAMQRALGSSGVIILSIVIIAALSTSLLGFYRTLARLIHAVAQDGIMPAWFGVTNKDGVPRNAILAIMAISVFVPFVGRAAIGWIVDVTSESAAIVYGYAALCCFIVARGEHNRAMQVIGVVGMVSAAVFLVYPLVPGFWSVAALSAESYLILVAWSIVGLLLFRTAFKRDTRNRFGKSTIVWILMIFLILFASTMWMRQITHDNMEEIIVAMNEYDSKEYVGMTDEEEYLLDKQREAHLAEQTDDMRMTLLNSSLVQTAMILFSLIIMFNIYSLMLKREREHDMNRLKAEAMSSAKTAFLSNMSHDIRTPMNAIIGYTHLALRDNMELEDTRMYLRKINASSSHLLGLINDVLEMSRIESGKMELNPTPIDICKLIDDSHNLFDMQMKEKGIRFTSDTSGVRDRRVLCDATYLDRVLLNLVGNAYKFTESGGEITVSVTQTDEAAPGRAHYVISVKDTGIGMTPEFAARVFEAFERERSATVDNIQGTGLGMAITKRIVTAMEGTIDVVSELGVGTEFVINVDYDVVEGEDADAGEHDEAEQFDFTGTRILVVDDNEINLEIAQLILEDAGFVVDCAENGQVAFDAITNPEGAGYDVVLTDIRMPVMNGRELTQKVRALEDPHLAQIPIIAAGANAFADDVRANLEAGMDAFVAKPLDVNKLLETLADIMKSKPRSS